MKIIFLEEAANLGGARIATADLASHLCKIDGYSAKIYDISGTCNEFRNYCLSKNVEFNVVAQTDKPLIISSKSLLRRLQKSLKLLIRLITIKKKLRQILIEERPDYIIVNGYRRLLYLHGIKTTATICFYAHGWYIPQQISKYQKFLLRHVVNKFLCVSQATKHALFANGFLPLKDIHVVHNGIDISSLRTDIANIPNSEGRFKILHCGGFTRDKSQLISLEIAHILKQKGFKFTLVFTGIIYAQEESKRYYNRVKQKINEYNLESNVLFVVGHSNVIDYFRACDVLIHPSETEGLPLVVMEAMALKKPVIANSVGGVTDYILDGYTGFLPPHDNAKEYANKIVQLAQDKNLYDYIVNNAYALVSQHYTIDTQLNSFLKALNN